MTTTISSPTVEDIERWAEVVDARQVFVSDSKSQYQWEVPQRRDSVLVELRGIAGGSDPEIWVTTDSPAPLNVGAPLSEWQIRQTIDDHQLFTVLEFETDAGHSCSVAIWGPRAKHDGEGITLIDANPRAFLLDGD